MLRVRVAAVYVMGWVLTASGAMAGSPDLVAAFGAGFPQAGPQRLERAEVIDAETGAELKLIGRSDGSLQVSLAWTDLEVRRVIQPTGDFHVRIAGRRDLVVLVRSGDRLRIARDGQTALVRLNQADEEGLDQAQRVLAGSHAMRAFRGLRSRMSADSLASAPGVSIDCLDILLGVLVGDPSAAERGNPRTPRVPSRLSRISSRSGGTCYEEYETEVCAAWDDYSACIESVKWYPGLQEVCAFTWLLRIESAWFRFIACSSFPLKVQ